MFERPLLYMWLNRNTSLQCCQVLTSMPSKHVEYAFEDILRNFRYYNYLFSFSRCFIWGHLYVIKTYEYMFWNMWIYERYYGHIVFSRHGVCSFVGTCIATFSNKMILFSGWNYWLKDIECISLINNCFNLFVNGTCCDIRIVSHLAILRWPPFIWTSVTLHVLTSGSPVLSCHLPKPSHRLN